MRRLFAPLSRWLDRRIDARIAAALERSGAHSAAALVRGTKAARQQPISLGGFPLLLTGHVALAEMAAAGICDAATVQREAGRHVGHVNLPGPDTASTRWVV